MPEFDPRIIVALDFEDSKKAFQLVSCLDPKLCRLKVGKEMFTHYGPSFVEALHEKGFDVFLDLKFHDIPNTVAKACLAAAKLGVWMVNVHASGGRTMMSHVMTVLNEQFGDKRPLVTAVTLLTSLTELDVAEIGYRMKTFEQVQHLAKLAQVSGVDGVVCSALEAAQLKSTLGQSFKLVTPGIRPANSAADDQTRIVTPNQAVKNGSDYLVIGRPITQSSDPLKSLCEISDSIQPLLQ